MPNITFQSQGIPYYIPLSYLSSLVPKDPLFVSTLNAGVVNATTVNSISTFARSISTSYIETTEAYVDDKLTLDNQVLTANSTDLLLNGIPLVTTANISSLSDWALDPAVSTIQADGNDLIDVRAGYFSSIVADGLTVVKLTTLFSTTIEVFESTITSETQKLTVSSINGGHAFFDFLTAGSIINPAASTITCDFLNVASNATFSNGATFSGTRPNFNTGINTSGANNFNNTNLDNCGQINAGALNLFGSATVGVLADSGGSILTNTAISLATQNGGSSVINIEAKRNALLAYPVPLSQVNIVAEGNCPNIPVVPLTPYGGAVNISANAGQDPIFPLTAITDAFAPGAIHLTAYSKGLFPGLITEAAGSILAYSGLTNPTAGLFGCSFYSALTCLSLSAGLSPALTSFPGTVLLRGDNGTKVVNGLYCDNLYNDAGGNLNITTQGGYWVDINNTQALRMGNNALIDGGGGTTSIIQNFFSISGSNVNTPQLNATNVSTSTLSVGAINTTSISIGNIESLTNVDLTINANQTIDGFEDPQPNNLNLIATSNINITIPNNNAYSINMSGSVYVSKNLYVTSNIDVATINGVPPSFGVPNDLTVSSINAPLALFSTVNASTLTFSAQENISLNANVPLPTFLNTGNIAMNAEKDIDLMANIGLTVGAGNDIDITASSTITITGQNIDILGARTLEALSTQQITITQTAGSDFVLFNNGDTRMRAVRDAYVEGVRDTYLLANQNMNVRAPASQYITIQQTGTPANDSFIQFTPNGTVEQFSRENMAIRTLSTNNITLIQTGAGNQSYFQLTPPGHVVLNARTYFETISPSGSFFTSPFTELRGYLTFNTSNNYLNNVRHIYGDIGGGGGGLAIDYMYGLFFNGTGRNANLYIDSGNLNMINYNSGLNLATYNSNGTGNFSLYSASNDMYLGTGTGRDININGGRYVSVNAAQPGGTFGIYASTINSTTLEDTNLTANRNMTLNSSSNININSVIDTNITSQKNMVLSASNSGNYITLNSGEVNRTLSGTSISQPVIQYNTISSSGNNGSQTVALPTPYTSGTSYVAFACMEDADPGEISVVRDNLSSITIYWAQAGGGSHTIAWNTMGL